MRDWGCWAVVCGSIQILAAAAQAPTVFGGGVVNGASFIPYGQPGYGIAPRSIVSIYGSALARSTASADRVPLPTQLAGTTVSFAGTPAPLLYVSPGQINAQVPATLLEPPDTVTTVPVVVTTAAGQSHPISVEIRDRGLALFTRNAQGCGQGTVLNVHSDHSVSLNTPLDSFDPSSDLGLTLFGTGLGAFASSNPAPEDGVAPVFDPERNLAGVVSAVFGAPQTAQVLQVDYAGPSPEWTGVDQFNILTSANPILNDRARADGCAMPLYVTDSETSASRPVAVSISHGGGPCEQAVPDRAGEIRWERDFTEDATQATASRLIAYFYESQGAGLEPLADVSICSSGRIAPASLPCANLAQRRLDAGTLTVQGPGLGPLKIKRDPATSEYRAELARAAVTGGQYRVTGSGGVDIGPFDTLVSIPAPIEIAGDWVSTLGTGAARLTWSAGQPGGVVHARVAFQPPAATSLLGSEITASAAAPGGAIDFCACDTRLTAGTAADVTVTQTPESASAQTFAAAGLPHGGRHAWQYRFSSRRRQTQRGAVCALQRRTVPESEIGSIFTTPNGFGWRELGAYVGAPDSVKFAQLNPNALKIVHGRFDVFKPSDDVSWVFFPYSELKRYEAAEMKAGRPPIFVTATYRGTTRPVLWNWSLALEGNRPTAPARDWKQAVNVSDDRFVRFWIDRYVRTVLWKRFFNVPNLWVGLDECAFNWDLYGVLDDKNNFVTGVRWDAPFPQSSAQYFASIAAFFARVKELAPDIKVMCNVGGMSDWTQFPAVFANVDGIMVEEIFDRDGSAFARNKISHQYEFYSWIGTQGKVAILRTSVPANDPGLTRTAYAIYLLLRGPNFFFAPRIESTYSALPPSRFEKMRIDLGMPAGPLQVRAEPGLSEGYRLYWRETQNGIVYLNWTGKTKEIVLPAGRQYLSIDGAPISRLTVPDMTGTYVLKKRAS